MDENKNQNGAFDDFSIEDILNSINQKADQKVSEHLNDIKTPDGSASTTDGSTAAADGKADDKPAGNSEKRNEEAAAPDKSG